MGYFLVCTITARRATTTSLSLWEVSVAAYLRAKRVTKASPQTNIASSFFFLLSFPPFLFSFLLLVLSKKSSFKNKKKIKKNLPIHYVVVVIVFMDSRFITYNNEYTCVIVITKG